MIVPDGMTEEEVVKIIDNVANRLAYTYKFGYHDIDDMKQEARLLALEGMEKYDNVRPLENFLWTHVRNRLYNFKRNKFARPGYPCEKCPFDAWKPANDECTKYGDKDECKLYKVWFTRNNAKRNIMSPIGLGTVQDEHECNMKQEFDVMAHIDGKNLNKLIEKKLSLDLRTDYIRFKNGLTVSKARHTVLMEAIMDIVYEEG